jgi:hypothetical protein
MKFRPDFADRVLQAYEEHEHRRKRRTVAVVLTLGLVGGVFVMSTRLSDEGQRPAIAHSQPRPVRPIVPPAPVRLPGPSQNAVREQTPGIVHGSARADRLPVNVAQVSTTAAEQNQGREQTSGRPQPAHDPSVALVTTRKETEPQEVVIRLDGKEYRCPPDFWETLDRQPSIKTVRDGKLVKQQGRALPELRRCRAVPTPPE